MSFILKNITYFGRGWSVYLFCSRQNYPFLMHILGEKAKSVHVSVLYSDNATAEEGKRQYNQLLKRKEFWESIDAENICTVEMDSYFRRSIPDKILQFDYVGSPWAWMPNSPGGGGLTFRRRSAMLRLCKEYNCDPAVNQDEYAANGCLALGLQYAEHDIASQHLVENCFTPNPVGLHQWWAYVGEYLGYDAYLGGKPRQPPPDEAFLRSLEGMIENYLRFELY